MGKNDDDAKKAANEEATIIASKKLSGLLKDLLVDHDILITGASIESFPTGSVINITAVKIEEKFNKEEVVIVEDQNLARTVSDKIRGIQSNQRKHGAVARDAEEAPTVDNQSPKNDFQGRN